MKRILPALLLAFAASAAFAQTGGVPPEQAPAGDPGKASFKKPVKAASTPTASTDTPAPTTKAERRAARKAKRAAKVGDKPLN